MMACKSMFLVTVLFCLSYVNANVAVADLQPLVTTAEDTLTAAKNHVEHMLNLSPVPNAEKIPPIVKSESDHLAHEIKKLASQLHNAISEGEHKSEMTAALNAAETHLNEAATALEHVGADVKEDNTHYFVAANKLLAQIKNVLAVGPCDVVSPHLKAALEELRHDVNNYQFSIHEAVGEHGAVAGAAGHIGAGAHVHHHVHSHDGASSEEDNSKAHSHSHSHSHHSH